jgi:hypothetical protein
LKNSSNRQPFLYKAAIVSGGRPVMLVRKTRVLPYSNTPFVHLGAHTGITAMAIDDSTERLPWSVLHDLRKK